MASTTLKALLEGFVEEYSLGKLGTTTSAGDTTSLIDVTRFGRPSAGNEWARNTPVRITARAAVVGGNITIGSERFVSDFDPPTGDFTLSPAMDDTPEIGTQFIVLNPNVADSTDRLVEAINRFLTRIARRRDMIPLTLAGQAATLLGPTSLWTLSNATVVYVEGDAQEPQASRYLQVTASAGNGYASTGSFSVAEDEVYDFYVPVVWPSATSTLQVVIWDATAGAAITPTYHAGAASITGAHRQAVRGHFTVPSGCDLVEVRYRVVTSGHVGLFGPCFVQRQNAYELPIPIEIDVPHELGQLYSIDNLEGSTDVVSGTGSRWYAADRGYSVVQRGFGMVALFGDTPPFPCAINASIPYAPLTAGDPTAAASGSAASESDTTNCPQPLAIAGAAVEFFKWAQREERQQRGPDSHSTRWDGQLADAEAALVTAQSNWNAPRRITTRRHFSGFARA